MTAEERSVLAANEAFYQAFRDKDLDGMEALWAQDLDVAVIHPGWPPLHGRAPVMESWARILSGDSPPVRCSNAHVQILGAAAFVICRETLPGGDCIATNLFAREGNDETWRLVHHQAGSTPPLPRAAPGETMH